MSTKFTPTSNQLALGQDILSDRASYRLLDNVDIIDNISTLRDLISHPVTPRIMAQKSAPTLRRNGHQRRRSTHQHSRPLPNFQPRAIIHGRRSRTHRPVWYQKQRRREYKEAVRNMKLDELRRLELMELWEEEWFELIMNALTQHLKRAVLALARELRREMERLDEMELKLLNEMEDLG